MAHILVVDGNPEERFRIEQTLGHEHELRMVAAIGESGHNRAAQGFDLVLVDIGQQDGDGATVCDRLQHADDTRGVPVVFLTTSEQLRSEVLALQLGAEDYLVKPFHAAELAARVAARLRRAASERTPVLAIGDLRIDLTRFVVEFGDGSCSIDLTPCELRLLHLLARRAERVITRTQILESVWADVVVTQRTVDTHVCNIRRKLGRSRVSIHGVRGVGYRLRVATAAAIHE